MIEGIKTYGSEDLLNKIKNLEPVFLCTIATTETSKIPEITGAGASPELTEYTPAADVEFMKTGTVLCMDEIPVSTEGEVNAPTPALITTAAINAGDIPLIVVDAGCKISPQIETEKVGNDYGRDIRTGKAVKNPKEIFENAKKLGKELSKKYDYIVIGESIAAGTTTALGVLKALGYSAENKVSASMIINPHELKIKVVDEGLKNSGLDLENVDPFDAISAVGDPMIPAVAGLTIGSDVPIILAGATQMMGVCGVIKAIEPNFDFSRVNVATTLYVAEDKTSDIFDLAKQIDENLTINIVDPEFENCKNPGLKTYADGYAKEGAGAGGAMFTALVKGVSLKDLQRSIDEI
ncbi:MAG: TIGR00303 family protein [Methanobacteriaceae archaeon]|jgi:uncharacterized protein (TIGR00303 family)|nr:TIGR00303 family protein [Methanobacteriaceae archaeon]